MSGLPEQADFRNKVPLLPCPIVGDQIREQIAEILGIRMHLMDCPEAVRQPRAVVPWLCVRGSKPVATVVFGVVRVSQPANLIQLVPGWTGDGSVGPGPEGTVSELREGIAGVG